MLPHQMAFRWRADDGPLIALSPHQLKVGFGLKTSWERLNSHKLAFCSYNTY